MLIKFHNFSFNNNGLVDSIKEFTDKLDYQNYPLLDVANQFSSSEIDLANFLRDNFKKVILIGMGGAMLNPQMLTAIKYNSESKIIFIDNLDSVYIQKVLKSIDLNDCAILSISKSGNTIETIAITSSVISYFKEKNINLENKLYAITSENSSLFQLATSYNAHIILHNKKIGGRFSTFTSVGLIPSIICGLDFNKFIYSAKATVEEFLKNPMQEDLITSIAFLLHKPISVLFTFTKDLKSFTKWYAQIIAESLGKNGKGITPIRAEGPLDQHSQLQLYFDGPLDKSFTLYFNNQSKPFDFNFSLEGKELSLNKVLELEYNSLLKMFNKNELPIREVYFNKFDEEVLGKLVVYSLLEIMIIAHYFQINPFDQPAIEQNKLNSRMIIMSK
ncbi:MAG: hypothetical protein J0H68_06520 [Sphingobacteriia bacterium]|nr:hypothetical protein [Sphingobacteriia bacterium]